MFKSTEAASQFLEFTGVPPERFDAMTPPKVRELASKALYGIIKDHRRLRLDMNDVASIVEPLTGEAPSGGAVMAALRRMESFYQARTDADEKRSLWVYAEIPIQSAIELQSMVGQANWIKAERPESYHITLAYLGHHDKGDITPQILSLLGRSLSNGLQHYGPLVGSLSGSGRMVGKMGDGDAFYLSPGLKGLVALRQFVRERAEIAGFPVKSAYDFIPHITIGYLVPGSPSPTVDLKSIDLTVNRITIGVERTPFQSLTLVGDRRFDSFLSDLPYAGLGQDAKNLTQVFKVGARSITVHMLQQMTHHPKYRDEPHIVQRGLVGQGSNAIECYIGPTTISPEIYNIIETNAVSGEPTSKVMMIHFAKAEDARKAYMAFKGERNFGVISRVPSYESEPKIQHERKDAAMPKSSRSRARSRRARKKYRATHPQEEECAGAGVGKWMRWLNQWTRMDASPVIEKKGIVNLPHEPLTPVAQSLYTWNLSTPQVIALAPRMSETVERVALKNAMASVGSMSKLVGIIRLFADQEKALTRCEALVISLAETLHTTHLPHAPNYYARSNVAVPELHRKLRVIGQAVDKLRGLLPEAKAHNRHLATIQDHMDEVLDSSHPDKLRKLAIAKSIFAQNAIVRLTSYSLDNIEKRIRWAKHHLAYMPYSVRQSPRPARDKTSQVEAQRRQADPSILELIQRIYTSFGIARTTHTYITSVAGQLKRSIDGSSTHTLRQDFADRALQQIDLAQNIRLDHDALCKVGDDTDPHLVDLLQETRHIDSLFDAEVEDLQVVADETALDLSRVAAANYALSQAKNPSVRYALQFLKHGTELLSPIKITSRGQSEQLATILTRRLSPLAQEAVAHASTACQLIAHDIIDAQRALNELEYATEVLNPSLPLAKTPLRFPKAHQAIKTAIASGPSLPHGADIANQFVANVKAANKALSQGLSPADIPQVNAMEMLIQSAQDQAQDVLPDLSSHALMLNHPRMAIALSEGAWSPEQQRFDADDDDDLIDLMTDRFLQPLFSNYQPIIATAQNLIQKNGLKKGIGDDISMLFKMKTKEQTKGLEQAMYLAQLAGELEVKTEDVGRMRFDGLNPWTLETEVGWRFDRKKVPPWLKMPFTEAVDYFRQKERLGTSSTKDVPGDVHQWAFMVSGVNRADILSAIQWTIDNALENGITEENYHRQFNRLIGRRGFMPDSWRVRTIFETNMRSAYTAGRYKQTFDPNMSRDRILIYRHGDSRQPRPLHLALHNKGIIMSHKFWEIAYPINGYGCKCRVFSLSREMAIAKKITILENPPDPKLVAEEGFRSNPSKVFDPVAREEFKKQSLKRMAPSVSKQLIQLPETD